MLKGKTLERKSRKAQARADLRMRETEKEIERGSGESVSGWYIKDEGNGWWGRVFAEFSGISLAGVLAFCLFAPTGNAVFPVLFELNRYFASFLLLFLS